MLDTSDSEQCHNVWIETNTCLTSSLLTAVSNGSRTTVKLSCQLCPTPDALVLRRREDFLTCMTSFGHLDCSITDVQTSFNHLTTTLQGSKPGEFCTVMLSYP